MCLLTGIQLACRYLYLSSRDIWDIHGYYGIIWWVTFGCKPSLLMMESFLEDHPRKGHGTEVASPHFPQLLPRKCGRPPHGSKYGNHRRGWRGTRRSKSEWMGGSY